MGMLDRYKKSGGFVQLLNLIETSPPAKQEKFLSLISEESPVWSVEVRKKMLTLDRVITWNVEYLMEFVPNIPDKIVAAAIWNCTPEEKEKVLKAVSSAFRKRVEEHWEAPPPSNGEMTTCQMKFIQEARTASTTGTLKLEKIDPELAIPEEVEEKLRDKFSLNSRGSGSTSTSAPSSSHHTSAAGSPKNSTQPVGDEMEMRRKIIQLEGELQNLARENNMLKDKLLQIRKIA